MTALLKFHRWISTACVVLLAWVVLTGTLLSVDQLTQPHQRLGPPPDSDQHSMPEQAEVDGAARAPDSPSAPPEMQLNVYVQTRNRIHFLLQDLHSGAVIGLSGRILDLLAGLAFMFLSASGFVLFLRKRRGSRTVEMSKPGVNYKASPTFESLPVRGIHRLVAGGGAIALFYVAITGTALQTAELKFGKPVPPPTHNPAPVTTPPIAATKIEGDALSVSSHTVTPSVTANRASFPSGVGPLPPTGPTFTLLRIHSMSFLGLAGYVIDVLAGATFLTMLCSGVLMFFHMYSRRRRVGRMAPFWK